MHPGQHEMNYPFNIHEGFNKISDRLWLFEHKLFLNNLYNIAWNAAGGNLYNCREKSVSESDN